MGRRAGRGGTFAIAPGVLEPSRSFGGAKRALAACAEGWADVCAVGSEEGRVLRQAAAAQRGLRPRESHQEVNLARRHCCSSGWMLPPLLVCLKVLESPRATQCEICVTRSNSPPPPLISTAAGPQPYTHRLQHHQYRTS
jgi:hypothetical protein